MKNITKITWLPLDIIHFQIYYNEESNYILSTTTKTTNTMFLSISQWLPDWLIIAGWLPNYLATRLTHYQIVRLPFNDYLIT